MWWHSKNLHTINNTIYNRSIETPASVNSLSDSAICRPLEESLRSTPAALWARFKRLWAFWMISGRFVCCPHKSPPFFLHAELDTNNKRPAVSSSSSVPIVSVLLSALCLWCGVQSDCSDRWSLSGLFTLSVRTMQVGRWRLSITISCCRSDFSSSIWDFSSEFSVSNRSDS